MIDEYMYILFDLNVACCERALVKR